MALTEDRATTARRVAKVIIDCLNARGIQTDAVAPEIWADVGEAALAASVPQLAWGDMVMIGARAE